MPAARLHDQHPVKTCGLADHLVRARRREPSLDELFHDGAMQLLMRRDGVSGSDVRTLLEELRDARGRLGRNRAKTTECSIAKNLPGNR